MIADAQWRLLRVPEAEAGFFIVGERKLGDLYPNEADPERHVQLMRTEIRIAFSKDLSNLYLQESRLNRLLDKYKAQLEQIQENRRNKLAKELNIAMMETQAAIHEGKPLFDPAQFGFEFTKAEFDFWHPRAKQHYQVTKNWPDFHKLIKEFLQHPKNSKSRLVLWRRPVACRAETHLGAQILAPKRRTGSVSPPRGSPAHARISLGHHSQEQLPPHRLR